MNKIKKYLGAVLIFALVISTFSIFTGCGKKAEGTDKAESKKLSVVATSFAPFDLARQVAGDNADVTMLLPAGAESHTFEPTPKDIQKIMNADVFIYVGGDSDDYVADILKSIDTSKVKVITLMDCVDLVEEELKEGMTPEKEDEDEKKDDGDDKKDDEEEKEYDEHVWTSPRNAIRIADKISETLQGIDADHVASYKSNTEKLDAQLTDLDNQFKDVVANGSRKTLVFGDRFPMRYFVEAYGLDYYAAFPGCSADTEANAATIAFLIDKVKAEKIPVVFTIELSNGKIADTICESTGAKKMQWNAIHNVTPEQFNSGVTYVDLQKQNVESLREALK